MGVPACRSAFTSKPKRSASRRGYGLQGDTGLGQEFVEQVEVFPLERALYKAGHKLPDNYRRDEQLFGLFHAADYQFFTAVKSRVAKWSSRVSARRICLTVPSGRRSSSALRSLPL